jgi:hypothetical protein
MTRIPSLNGKISSLGQNVPLSPVSERKNNLSAALLVFTGDDAPIKDAAGRVPSGSLLLLTA